MAVASAGHVQVCTSLQTDNHASTSPLSFLQAGCPSCRPTNSVKELKAQGRPINKKKFRYISPICPEAPPSTDLHQIWRAAIGTADVITCTKFFADRSRGVDSVGFRKLPSPIDKASRRYHRAGATAQPVITSH